MITWSPHRNDTVAKQDKTKVRQAPVDKSKAAQASINDG